MTDYDPIREIDDGPHREGCDRFGCWGECWDDSFPDTELMHECHDPNCLVCCDRETFDRLTNKRTDNMMTLEADDD